MNDIEKARAKVNRRVAECIKSHAEMPYSQIAETLGVSRWRVVNVASGLGITRKSGPKRKNVTGQP